MEETTNTNVADQEFIQRFGLQFRYQHFFMFVSTIALVISGIPLWCLGRPEYAWSQKMAVAFGNIDCVRACHRISAAILIAVSLYHVLYTFLSRQGRREFIHLLPKLKDVQDVLQNSLYFLGLSKKRPQFDRYTYYEKFDYWAVYWGCVIMIGTGLALWFPQLFGQHVPWLTYELAAEIHADEAILAALALFVWHFYNVHFQPSRFPGTMLWWHGKMSKEEMLHDHPLEYEKILEEAKNK